MAPVFVEDQEEGEHWGLHECLMLQPEATGLVSRCLQFADSHEQDGSSLNVPRLCIYREWFGIKVYLIQDPS